MTEGKRNGNISFPYFFTKKKRNGNIQHRLYRHRETDRDGDIHCCQEQEDQQELVYVRRRHKLQPPPSLQLFSALRLLLLQPPFPLSSNLDSSLLFYLPLLQITTQVAINVVTETKAEKKKKEVIMMMMLRYETKTGDLGLCLCLCCMEVRKMAGEGDKSLPNACKKWSASVCFFLLLSSIYTPFLPHYYIAHHCYFIYEKGIN